MPAVCSKRSTLPYAYMMYAFPSKAHGRRPDSVFALQ